MTDQQIRLHFGELNAAEMRLARAIVGWHEAREAKLRAAADGLAEALEDSMFYLPAANLKHKRAALAAYQATKP
jgi:hypothetical protein